MYIFCIGRLNTLKMKTALYRGMMNRNWWLSTWHGGGVCNKPYAPCLRPANCACAHDFLKLQLLFLHGPMQVSPPSGEQTG